MSDRPREAIPEDIDFDPTYARQRKLAAWLLGLTLNHARGIHFFDGPRDDIERAKRLNEIEQIAVGNGIVTFDEWHHALACPANHFHKKRMPTGPCTCGAAARKIR